MIVDNDGEMDSITDAEPAALQNDTKFPSLSSEENGYHMGTPPPISLDSDIQPCAVDTVDIQDSGPASLTTVSDTVSSSVSSDYKVITESESVEKCGSGTNNLLRTDILCAESSTDDQMSSGTFSQDEISPRYAELPESLSVEKRRTQSSSDAPRMPETFSELRRRSSASQKQDRTLSVETRSTSIASDASEQEIPPTTPRSDPGDVASPGSESQSKFDYDNTSAPEKSSTDLMTQSIYVGSDDSEVSSESHLSTMQTTQQTISSSEDSNAKVTTMVTEESVFESVIKLSENVTENILEETKTITKSTKMAVEESIVLQESTDSSEEKLLKTEDSSAADNKTQSIKLVSTESSVMVTKTDTRTYSDVLKSDKYSDSKQTVTTSSSASQRKSSLGQQAAAEVLKTDSVLQMVGSSSKSSSETDKAKKLSYSEVVKSENNKSQDKKDSNKDPIADWGKPLGLPSPIRPSTPAKQPKKNEDESVDSNKVYKFIDDLINVSISVLYLQKNDAIEPVWMDLAYVPHHGASNYTTEEFFKRVRARYYVFSGVDPSREVFNALIEAKKTWENKDQGDKMILNLNLVLTTICFQK